MESVFFFVYFSYLPTVVAIRGLDEGYNQTIAPTQELSNDVSLPTYASRVIPERFDDFNITDPKYVLNALFISDVSGVTDEECGTGKVLDISINACVVFGCPPTWKALKDEFKCEPIQASARNSKRSSTQVSKEVSANSFPGSSMYFVCLSLLSRSDHPAPKRDVLGSRDDLAWSPPCDIWESLKLNNLKFSATCELIVRDRRIPLKELYLEPFGNEYHVYFCMEYHYSSKCLLRWVNRTQAHQHQGNLYIHWSAEREVIYPLGMYVPFKEMYGVCIIPESTWIRIVRNAQRLISLIGACTSSCCYVLVLVTFAVSKELFPGHGVISMCVCLISADLLYLFIVVLHRVNPELFNHLCVGLAVMSHFLLLTELLSIVLLALDNLLALRQVQLLVHDTTRSYYAKRSLLLVIPTLIIVSVLILDHTQHLDGGYECGAGFCILQGLYARLAFYTIPMVITFRFSTSIMVFTLFKLRHHNQSAKMSEEGGSNNRSHNLTVIALKLIVAYGLIDVFGFIHSPLKSSLGKGMNVVLGLVYTSIRSMRGLMFVVIYLCRSSVVRFYRRCIGGRASIDGNADGCLAS